MKIYEAYLNGKYLRNDEYYKAKCHYCNQMQIGIKSLCFEGTYTVNRDKSIFNSKISMNLWSIKFK